MAIRWARRTFLQVIGKKAPALTVASLAIIIARRPEIVPMPVATPADGAPPHSVYISYAAHRPISNSSVLGSMSLSMRSRAVSRPLACWRSMAFEPPPCRIFWISLAKEDMERSVSFFLSRSQAPPGNAMFSRLCLAASAGGACGAGRSQAEPGNEGYRTMSAPGKR